MKEETMTCAIQSSKFAKQIKAANDLFNRLSPPERRVEIAKDVIKSLKLKKIRAKTGRFASLKHTQPNACDSTNMLEVFESTRCDCCARGAMFVSAVRKFDNVTAKDVGTGNVWVGEITDYNFKHIEDGYWDAKQIQMIETAFESEASYVLSDLLSDEEISVCKKFKKRYKTPEKRMIGIMRNIIKNKGTFKP